MWTQQLALVFGSSATANAAVLAAYMFGLGVGAWIASRFVRRVGRPLLAYAALELGIALAALLVGPLLEGVRWVQRGLFEAAALDGVTNAAFYVVASFVVLGLPTALMGATLPLLVRFWVRRPEEIGRGVAGLYMANTLGAACGVAAAGFVLLPTLGLWSTLRVAMALNVLVAVGVFFWSAAHRDQRDQASDGPLADATPNGNREARWPLLVALSGLVGMAYEVYWSRALTHVLGGSLYAFSAMLATFLLGIAIGSTAAALGRPTRRRAQWAYGATQAGIGLAFWVALTALDASWISKLLQADPLSPRSLALVVLALGPGAVLLGVAFPLAVLAASSTAEEGAVQSGRLYAFNTAGTIVGAIGCGFWALPRFGFDGTAALLVSLSFVGAGVAWSADGARGRWVAVVAVLGVVAVTLRGPDTPWRLLTRTVLGKSIGIEEVAYLGVGRSATVMLREENGDLRLTSDGLPESAILLRGSRPGRYAIARWLAQLPAAARPEARDALVIGFGAGITPRAFPPRIREIDVAEIEPEVLVANRRWANLRADDPFADPRIRALAVDARTLLETQSRSYDLIVSQPSHPWTAGASSLFTADFYELAGSRLRPGGVLLQWIGLRFLDADLLRSQIATLSSAFAHVEVYRPPPSGAALLLASQEPIDLQASLAETWPLDAETWKPSGVHTPEDVLLARWLSEPVARELANGAEVSTDARNLLAYRSSWNLSDRQLELRQSVEGLDAVRDLQAGRDDLYVVRRLLALQQWERAKEALAGVSSPSLARIGGSLQDLARGNRDQGILTLEDAREEGGPAERREASAALVDDRSRRAASAVEIDGVFEGLPAIRATWTAWQALEDGDVEVAERLDEELAEIDPKHPIFPLAHRLRVRWRYAKRDRDAAREALVLLDPHLQSLPGLQPLLLRAELALRADDADALWASLFEMERLDPPRGGARAQLRRLLQQVAEPPTMQDDPRAARRSGLLRKLRELAGST
ncbi:MAG: fused MFS/spermidine synthase [Acidobacteriota bacterium]